MALVKMTSEQAKAQGKIDREQIGAMTEADIARFNAEDGFDPDDTLEGYGVSTVQRRSVPRLG